MSLRDDIAEDHPDVLFADGPGFDEAILGVIERVGQPAFVVYDAQKIIACLMRDGLSEEEAWEHFDFNIAGAWVGPNTPAFLRQVDRPPEENPSGRSEDPDLKPRGGTNGETGVRWKP